MTKTIPLTKEQAKHIRHMRVTCGYSWRSIARDIARLWPELGIKTHPDGCGYQAEGMDLCQEAAEFFGEDASKDPWNWF